MYGNWTVVQAELDTDATYAIWGKDFEMHLNTNRLVPILNILELIYRDHHLINGLINIQLKKYINVSNI